MYYNRFNIFNNVSILDYTGAKDDGIQGDNWGYEMCKAPVKSSPTNQYPAFYKLHALPVALALKRQSILLHGIISRSKTEAG